MTADFPVCDQTTVTRMHNLVQGMSEALWNAQEQQRDLVNQAQQAMDLLEVLLSMHTGHLVSREDPW